ncbi:NADP-dependent oxidoreductase [Algibacillus agarilyticus]|uniref:NADP-dependent oxidoreductase n=1 Tax=Algibacillus agarilyticus TaxID=2234133 RepID=UPI000DD05FCE|nr:NADP-dependent oxidoreductase [Algibacillus agarilyticus]
MSTYRASSIPFFGDAHVLRIEEFDLPSIKPNEYLVNIVAASVNPIDCKTRAGLGWAAAENKDKLPWVPGYDMAGIVTAVGAEKNSKKIGRYVFGMVGFPLSAGAYSEYRVVDESDVLEIPANVSLQQAAALPLAGLTAYQALFEHGNIADNQRVLILGATGGVGHIAAQLALTCTPDVICSGSLDKQAELNYLDSPTMWRSIETLSGDFDLVLDCVGGQVALDLLAQLGEVKTWVTLPTLTAKAIADEATHLSKQTNVINFLVNNNIAQLKTLIDLVSAGQLNVYIGAEYPLSAVATAHEIVETRACAGKVLLDLG